MEKMMGLINLDPEQEMFNELTYFRNGASLPFGGRYRLIDFALSNMVDSNIEEVAIFTRNKYRSLMDHLGTGESWNLDRRNGGLFVLPPDWNDPTDVSKGDLRFFHNNQDYFNRSQSSYVLIGGSQFIANANYEEAFEFHLNRKADVTLISVKVDELSQEHHPYCRVEADEKKWVQDITYDQNNHHVFTGLYIINKELLMKLVDHCIAYGKDNFFTHGVREHLADLKVQTYDHEGDHAFINTVEGFYRENMNLLSEEKYLNLLYKPKFIRTKVSDNPPVKYENGSSINKSIVSNGCVIEGDVDQSVLFRGVSVKKGSVIKNSIIMQQCTIEEGAYLENVILDKDVHITAGQRIIGSNEKPYVVAKRQVI